MGLEFPSTRLVRAHFYLAALGVLLAVVPLGIAGVSETIQLVQPKAEFLGIIRSTIGFLRVSTIGELLLLLGQVLFLVNLAGLALRFYRVRAAAVYEVATADLYPAKGAKA